MLFLRFLLRSILKGIDGSNIAVYHTMRPRKTLENNHSHLNFTLNTHIKMAIRAVVVTLVCILITHTFALERAYWTFLPAFMLITQSFGDWIYRSLVRFIMTIIGFLIGWLLYLPFAHY